MFHHKLEPVWLRAYFCILFFSIPSTRWLHYDTYDYAAWHSLVVNVDDIISNTNGFSSYVIFYPKFIIQEFRMYKVCYTDNLSKSYDFCIFYNKFQFRLIIEAKRLLVRHLVLVVVSCMILKFVDEPS